jgi:hypothetical protein
MEDLTIRTCPPAESPLERQRQRGHRQRTGHEAVSVLVSVDGILWHRVNECCGDTIEAAIESGRVTTWAQQIPASPLTED